MASRLVRTAQRPRFWGLVCVTLLLSSTAAQAQFGYPGYGYGYGGYGYPGFTYGYVGNGSFGGYSGYGGVGGLSPYASGFGGYGYGGFGYGGVGVGYNGFGGSYGGYPLQSSINAYNLGYGNTQGIGLVPPAYVGTGTAGLGPVGIGGINPLFGLGLSPLAIHNAVAEQSLRQRAGLTGYYRGYSGGVTRVNLYNNTNIPGAVNNNTIPGAVNNNTIPGAVSTVPR